MSSAIFIHGAGGFVGTHLMQRLVARGEHVIASNRSAFDAPEVVETCVGELREPEQFSPFVARCRAVVHLASRSTPNSTVGDPLAELRDNLHPTLGLLASLQAHPRVHLVYVSSGGNLYPPRSGPADESVPPMPRSYHGAGKAAAEQFIVAWCAQYGTRATILRPSNVYGPGQSERAGFGIIPAAMQRALRSEPLTLWGDGSAVRDYLYIDDFISLCEAALDDPAQIGCEIFNASSGRPTRLDELLALIERVSGRRLHCEYAAPRSVDAPRVEIDHGAVTRRYGWTPAVDLFEGLARTWAWSISRA